MTTQHDPVEDAVAFLKAKDKLNGAANKYLELKTIVDTVFARLTRIPVTFLDRCARECDSKANKLIQGFDYDKYTRFRKLIGFRYANNEKSKNAQARVFNSFGDVK